MRSISTVESVITPTPQTLLSSVVTQNQMKLMKPGLIWFNINAHSHKLHFLFTTVKIPISKKQCTNLFLFLPIFFLNTYNQNLFYENIWCGLCVMVEYKTVFNTGKVHLFKLLCNHIQLWIDQQKSNATFIHDVSLFCNLLEGKESDLYSLEHKLQLDGWEKQDQMILVIASGISSDYNTQNYLCRTFSDISPYIYAVTYEDNVILLCNIAKLPKEPLFDHLMPWFKRASYHCGVSNPFFNLTDIYNSFLQTKATFLYGEKENEKKRAMASSSNIDDIPEEIHEVKKYMLPNIINHLISTMDYSCIHPKFTNFRNLTRLITALT